ncbi:large ribosomal subunit protein mL48 [Prorops nasuta]|uniref:large ribosomal subunit protein mL48 n=1 Tax=Prorops nasuta TaxID=863751 RepID=UPI0034CE1494
MALNVIKRITGSTTFPFINKILPRCYSLYEPDYLEVGKPKYPVYPTLNIQTRGYVYPILESYQKFTHKIIKRFNFDVENSWAMPPQKKLVQRLKPNSKAIDSEYTLYIYERNTQISNVTTVELSPFIRILEACLPEGVTLKVDIFDQEYEHKRYVPDKQLLDLKSTLEEIEEDKKKK